jgi:protein-S-isoprenylcysteine O-methyltransferase Ste14
MVEEKAPAPPTSEGGRPLYGDRSPLLGYIRIGLSFALAIAVLILAQPTPLLFILGLPFVLAGEWFHTWAHGHLIKTTELITSGPYAHTQNPLYLGRILMVTGFLIIAQLPWKLNWIILIAAFATFFAYYMPRKTRREGRRLKVFHGDAWVDYNKNVPVLFPSLTPYARSAGKKFSLNTMLTTNREWIMHFCFFAGMAILFCKAFIW